MGHEFCGEIARVGRDVRDWREGDRVVVQPTLSCGVRVPGYQPHRRPAALDAGIASLVEPTAVGVHGWGLAGLDRPDTVIVVGIGNIGLLAVRVARAKGARREATDGLGADLVQEARSYPSDQLIGAQD